MAIVAFVVWVAYGVWQWKQTPKLFAKLDTIAPQKRKALATLLLFGSAILLMATIYGIAQASPRVIPAWGWVVILVVGTIFVHAQSLAAAMIISTTRRGPGP